MNAFPRGFVAVLAISLFAIAAHPGDAAAYANACRNNVTANNSQISVTMTGTASGPVAPGGTITLSSIQQTATVPGDIFLAGYNLGLLVEGQNNVPANVFTRIEGTNTTEGVQATSLEAVVITTTIDDPDNVPGTGDETATDGQFTANYDDQTWTAGASPGTVEFRQDTIYPLSPTPAGSETGALIVRAIVGGVFQVRFACSPGTVTPPAPGTVTPIDPAETFASASIVGTTPTPTETPTPTVTETPSDTETPTPTATETEAPTPTETETPVATETATATPSVTATSTPSVTTTASPTTVPTPEPLNHFLCYETHQAPVKRAGVKLEDQFDPPGQPSTVTVQKAKRLCAPADKESEDPTAPDDVAHLSAYTIKQTSPKFVRRGPIPVAPDNPILFPMTVTLTRPSRLLVPAAKALGPTPPPALAAPIDHYKCYRVKGARTRLAGVSVETQFGTVTVDIKKPIELCTPVDKNGEGIVDDLRHLLCYQVRAAARTPEEVSTTNQFEQATFDVFGIRELCVPAFKFPGFCGDGEFNAPGEQCDGADAAACPGLCTPQCTCPAPTCGDGVINQQSEECDGTDAQACPGSCQPDCTCPAVCLNGVSTATCTCSNGATCFGTCSVFATCAETRAGCSSFCNQVAGDTNACAAVTCTDCVTNQPCLEETCGDGMRNQSSEECDGADASNCPGFCNAQCQCDPFCGDFIVNAPGEECDPPGDTNDCSQFQVCQAGCTCPDPFCGDGLRNGADECDGMDDSQCPDLCQPDCTCPVS